MPGRRGLVGPQPARRGLLARVVRVVRVRAAVQLRLQQFGVGAETACSHFGGQPRRALRLGLREELILGGQLRGGDVPRDAGPRVDAAPVQLPAQGCGQRRPLGGLQAHHLAGPPGQRLLGQAEQQFLRFLWANLPGFRRQN